jgi:hypothetical protein
MTASNMAQAGVSQADINSLRAVRNSPIRKTHLYQKIQKRIRDQTNAYLAHLASANRSTAMQSNT